MIFPDYHLHSSFSTDSSADMLDNIKNAKENGLTSICMTDHYDIDFPVREDEPEMDFKLDYEAYYKYLSELRDRLAPDFDLRIGVELGLMHEAIDKNQAFVDEHPEYDFFISSIHVVDKLDPYYPEYFADKTEKEGYLRYFETILENVKEYNGYNVYGHLDYILRCGPNKAKYFDIKDYYDVIYEILKTIIERGKGIEVNTAGLYKGLGFAHPHKDILKIYKALGGEIITVGSDSHDAKHVGYGFDVARDLLLDTGFKYYCTFKRQEASFNKIV
ncbi:MAG: histidinol-phosphatase HisJ family protein [Lachnospiraceae bacterium]|nr:histidinol-phosphatase HisJ family protein [Lachnospiraceae bacterium]